jgi:predicted secreted protein
MELNVWTPFPVSASQTVMLAPSISPVKASFTIPARLGDATADDVRKATKRNGLNMGIIQVPGSKDRLDC